MTAGDTGGPPGEHDGRSSPARVVTLGDAAIDVIVEPARLEVPDDDVPAAIRLEAGGQASNVAAWCSHLGGSAGVISVLGDDPAGRLIREMLASRNVAVMGPPGTGRSAVIVSLVGPGGRRTMLSDRGASATLTAEDLNPEWFAGARWLHLSGYSLFGPRGPEPAIAAAGLAAAAGARVSVDLSSATLLAGLPRARVRGLVADVRAEVVLGNELEVAAAGHLRVSELVVKRGAAGCRVIAGGASVDLPGVPPAAVRDSTGAGDAFAAGWLLGGAPLAMEAARRCVARLGAMPPTAEPLAGA